MPRTPELTPKWSDSDEPPPHQTSRFSATLCIILIAALAVAAIVVALKYKADPSQPSSPALVEKKK